MPGFILLYEDGAIYWESIHVLYSQPSVYMCRRVVLCWCVCLPVNIAHFNDQNKVHVHINVHVHVVQYIGVYLRLLSGGFTINLSILKLWREKKCK